MATITAQQLDQLIEHEWRCLDAEKHTWSLLSGDQDMEALEHVYRCILHLGHTARYADDFKAAVKVQNPDGGWSKFSGKRKTSIWITTFVGLKLARANVILKDAAIQAAVDRAFNFIMSAQEADGHWHDPEWSHLDTTCSVTVFLTVYQVTQGKKGDPRIGAARKRGFDYVMAWHRDSGLWKDNGFHPSGIETSAHLIQYTLVPAYLMDGIAFAEKACLEAADSMVAVQDANGSWDKDNFDHTMDSCRNLMLVADTFKQKDRYRDSITRGVEWTIENKNEKGWGDFIGEPSHVERTADGLDTVLKYRRFLTSEPMSHFWAYTI